MPPRLAIAVHILFVGLMLWVAVTYFGHALDNVRAGLWVGAVVDGLIWLVAISLCVWNIRQAVQKSR